MGYANESGYTPVTIESMMLSVMTNVNTQFGTSYTSDTFIGTNFYKFFYAMIQDAQKNDVKASEIFQYLQDYFRVTNAKISRPVDTNQGLIDKFETEGFVASVKPMEIADAGKINVAVDLKDNHARALVTITNIANLTTGTADKITVNGTDFTAQTGAVTPGAGTFRAATSTAATALSLATQINAHALGASIHAQADGALVNLRVIAGGTAGNAKTLAYTSNASVGATISGATFTGGFALSGSEVDFDTSRDEVFEILKDSTAAGCITQGAELKSMVLSNGQAFDFRFKLPNRIDVLLRLTITLSENNQVVIGNPDDVKQLLLSNIEARYRLGLNFEPQRYFTVVDAPWASQVLLEWSDDAGGSYQSDVYDSAFDDLFTFGLEDIELVEV